MSFWDKVKSAGNAVGQAASDAAASAKKAINDLQSYPSNVMCAGCQTTIPVPAAAWDWTCAKADCAKVNTTANPKNECSDCKTAKPKVPNPKVTCPKCNTVAVVPFSNAGRLLDDGKTVVVHTGKSAQKEFQYLQEKPSQFNCEHCQTLLGVPAPVPWTCTAPNCKTQNPADSAACAGCAAAKPATAGMVLCGVCNKATTVPSSNFWVKAKAEYNAAEKSLKKLYLDVASKPYILCPRCQTPLHVDLKKHQQQQAAAAAAASKPADGKVDKPEAAAAAAAAAGASAGAAAAAGAGAEGGEAVGGKASAGQSAPVPVAAPAEPPGVEVVCTKCSERLLVAVGSGGGAGAGAEGAAGAGAAAAPNAAAPPASN